MRLKSILLALVMLCAATGTASAGHHRGCYTTYCYTPCYYYYPCYFYCYCYYPCYYTPCYYPCYYTPGYYVGSPSAHGLAQAPVDLKVTLASLPADAKIYINDEPTQQTGEVRQFQTPELATEKSYEFTIEARDGDKVLAKAVVNAAAGKTTEVKLEGVKSVVAAAK
jgi:uncharacterized protein (TIGR03000 family)